MTHYWFNETIGSIKYQQVPRMLYWRYQPRYLEMNIHQKINVK